MDTRKTPRGLGRTTGASGTSILQGLIIGEEYNRRLVGKNGLRMYNIMRKSDATVRAALQIVKLPLQGLENDIKPALPDDPVETERAEFIESQLFKNPNFDFDAIKREALTFLDFGHSVAEITFGLVDFNGKPMIGITDLSFRKQDSILKWETEDGKPGITQLLSVAKDGKNQVSIIRERMVLFVNDQEGDNYEGISLLRYAYKDWDMKDKLGMVYAVGLEKMAIPTPVITSPLEQTGTTEETNAIESIRKYTSNEESFILVPKGWTLDKFDMSGQSIKEMLPALQYFDRQILKSVLGQFLELGASASSGSRAVSEDHSDIYKQSEEAINQIFVKAIQKQLIEPLIRLNYTDIPNGYPEYYTGRVQDDKIADMADSLQKLSSAGIITSDLELEKYVREKMHLPDISDEVEQLRLEKRATPDPVDPEKKKDPSLEKDKLQTKDKKAEAMHRLVSAHNKAIDIVLGS